MNRLPLLKLTLLVSCLLSICSSSYGQEGTVTIEQDKKIDLLLKERKQLYDTGELKNYFSIQVISGEIKTARETLAECKKMFTDYTSDIVYQTPHYKVWVGKFRNRIDADAALVLISETYPGAFVFKPENKK